MSERQATPWNRELMRSALLTPSPKLFNQWWGQARAQRGLDAKCGIDGSRSRIAEDRRKILGAQSYELETRPRLEQLKARFDVELLPEIQRVVEAAYLWAGQAEDLDAEALIQEELEHVLVGWRKLTEGSRDTYDVVIHSDESRALMKWAAFRFVHHAGRLHLTKRLAHAWDQAVGDSWTFKVQERLDDARGQLVQSGELEPSEHVLGEGALLDATFDEANAFVRLHAAVLVRSLSKARGGLVENGWLLNLDRDDLAMLRDAAAPPSEQEAMDRLIEECEHLWENPWETLEAQFRGAHWASDEVDLKRHVLLGARPDSYEAVTLARAAIQEHVQILGSSGSGKTSLGVIPLLRQLLRGSDEGPRSLQPGAPPPMLVMDLKGDWELFRAVEHEARANGQRFRLFTTSPRLHSEVFDPMQHLAACYDAPSQFAQDMGAALNLVYGEDYAHAFFGDANLTVLDEAFGAMRDDWSLESLAAQVQRRASKEKDFKGASRAIQSLTREPVRSRIVSDKPAGHHETVWMERVFAEREVVYVYLPGRSMEMQSRRVGKLLLNAFIGEAQRRHELVPGPVVQSYVFIDEFQNIAARNVGQMLTDVRSLGISMLMAHQGLDQLKIGAHTDIRAAVQTNARVRMLFSVPSPDELKYVQDMSGETLEQLISTMRSNAKGRTKGEAEHTMRSRFRSNSSGAGQSSGSSWGGSLYTNYNEGTSLVSSTAQGEGTGSGESRQQSSSETHSEGTREQPMYRPGMSASSALDASSMQRQCIVLTRDKKDLVEVSPASDVRFEGGRPRIVRCLYTVDPQMHELLAEAAPPRIKPLDSRAQEHDGSAKELQSQLTLLEAALEDGYAFVERIHAVSRRASVE